jgi:hypothetical protein
MENWRNVCQWLEGAGYKNQKKSQSQSNHSIPVTAQAHIINYEKQKIEIDVLIQLVLPSSSDALKETPTQ